MTPQPDNRITRMENVPFPSPDPWANDPPGLPRCPYCAKSRPGEVVCRRCGKPLKVYVRSSKPLSATMINLVGILFSRGPMALGILVIYKELGPHIYMPWTYGVVALLPLFMATCGGLVLRWRWMWYLAVILCGGDFLWQIGVAIFAPPGPLFTAISCMFDFICLGMLFMVYDEIKITPTPIEYPPDDALPRVSADAFRKGLDYSKCDQWYFAARMWQRAVSLAHQEAQYRRLLGIAYLRLHKLDVAERELNAAATINPSDPETQRALALFAAEIERREREPGE